MNGMNKIIPNENTNGELRNFYTAMSGSGNDGLNTDVCNSYYNSVCSYLDATIFLHGWRLNIRRGKDHGFCITVFSQPSEAYINDAPNTGRTRTVIEIPEDVIKLTTGGEPMLGAYYQTTISELGDIVTREYRHRTCVIAQGDSYGNLHFMDFPQINGNRSGKWHFLDIFYWIVKDWKESRTINLLSDFKQELSRIDCVVIKEVEVKAGFDKDVFISSCEQKLQKEIDLQRALHESTIVSLKNTLSDERNGRDRAVAKSQHDGFLLGLTFSKGTYLSWKMNADNTSPFFGYLEYWDMYRNAPRDIYVTELHYHGKKVMIDDIPTTHPLYNSGKVKHIVKGLRVKVRQAVHALDVQVEEDTYHPNCSGTSICIGDLEGKPILDILKKLPNVLTVGNLDSPLLSDATDDHRDLFYNDTGLKEGLLSTHVMTGSV